LDAVQAGARKIDKPHPPSVSGGGRMDAIIGIEVLENVTNFEIMCALLEKRIKMED
jgi:hypothetical protein